MDLVRRISLFRRLPKIRWRTQEEGEIAPAAVQNTYDALADDFEILKRELLPTFRYLDNRALLRQNQFRLAQVVLIVGGVIAAVLGAVQAALGATAWPGVTEAIVAGLVSAVAYWDHGVRPRDGYLSNRVAAEALRGEYFLFLGRLDPYADPDPEVRRRRLILRVAEIRVAATET